MLHLFTVALSSTSRLDVNSSLTMAVVLNVWKLRLTYPHLIYAFTSSPSPKTVLYYSKYEVTSMAALVGSVGPDSGSSSQKLSRLAPPHNTVHGLMNPDGGDDVWLSD